jgi:hypothetical protein
VSNSILTSVKKNLGLDESYEHFDQDIILYINAVLATLNQLGIGPDDGFQIEDKTATWDSLIGTEPRLNNVKSYVYLKVRLLFDPPANSFTIAAFENQIRELEVRINIFREGELCLEPVAVNKGTHVLSNKELQDLVTRMNLEQQYSRLTADQRSSSKAKKFLNSAQFVGRTTNEVISFVNSPAGKLIRKAVLKG